MWGKFVKNFLFGIAVGVVVGAPLMVAGVKQSTMQWLLWGSVLIAAGCRVFCEGVRRDG